MTTRTTRTGHVYQVTDNGYPADVNDDEAWNDILYKANVRFAHQTGLVSAVSGTAVGLVTAVVLRSPWFTYPTLLALAAVVYFVARWATLRFR